MLYTSGSRALCLTEIAVHIPFGIIPKDFILTSIEIPHDILIDEIKEENLPENWRVFPHPVLPQKVGTTFLKNETFLVLKVPSAVVQGEFNYLINPNHKDIGRIKIVEAESFYFDERLFRK